MITGLGRIHRQGSFWYGAKSNAVREAGRFLFRPRPWVTALADCVMQDAQLLPQRFLSVHIRHSVEKQQEGARLHVALPGLEAYNVMSVALAADLGVRKIFLQTASPEALNAFAAFCGRNGLELSYTNNSRSENDAWGGWKVGAEMEQSTVAAVNSYIGSRAAASVSPELSLWTHLLSWTFGPDGQPFASTRICCPHECRIQHSGSNMMEVATAPSVLGSAMQRMRKDCREQHVGKVGGA